MEPSHAIRMLFPHRLAATQNAAHFWLHADGEGWGCATQRKIVHLADCLELGQQCDQLVVLEFADEVAAEEELVVGLFGHPDDAGKHF